MNLSQKLQDLKNELKQREEEMTSCKNRAIVLRRLIKSTESLIKDAEEVFADETSSFTESANL
jgi:translation initiation factor 2B subunit (eIF-2B alpha/beta/delta family)